MHIPNTGSINSGYNANWLFVFTNRLQIDDKLSANVVVKPIRIPPAMASSNKNSKELIRSSLADMGKVIENETEVFLSDVHLIQQMNTSEALKLVRLQDKLELLIKDSQEIKQASRCPYFLSISLLLVFSTNQAQSNRQWIAHVW